MFKDSKNSFWQALIVALFVFGIGMVLGIFLEQSRASNVSDMYLKSELNLLDVRLQSEMLNLDNLHCNLILQNNILFGDKIYEDAKQLERYEKASRFTDALLEQHKKYDLLRTMFWINSINIKEKCGTNGTNFNTLVYLYKYSPENMEEENKQRIFSNFLAEIKNEYGNKVILIPIAMNMNLTSIDYMINLYSVNETSIILDEKSVFSNVEEFPKIREILSK